MSNEQEPKGNGHDKPRPEALGLVQYKTPSGAEIKLTTQIICAYFLADANDAEAHGFAGSCRFSGLNPSCARPTWSGARLSPHSSR
jgi:hypothetical protein